MSEDQAENIVDMLTAFLDARGRRRAAEACFNPEAAGQEQAAELAYRRELVARMVAAVPHPGPEQGEGGGR